MVAQAKVDPDICIGCTLCTRKCPEVFKIEVDKAVVYVKEIPRAVLAGCRQAKEECPVNAITITE